ncbi:MAG: hypothetical protein KAX38_08940 [Candidatus Krumholzibacteria bacterium]|nr:hypothetical protein [Candidatus Krumholzibacteria bacterium]
MRQLTETWKKIERIVGFDPRFKANAYSFVMVALEQAIDSLPEPRHVSGRELLEGIRISAVKQFGPMAKEVFNFWGVHSTEDFGHIVFNLVEADLLGKTDEDKIDDFIDVYDFKKVFEEDYYNR